MNGFDFFHLNTFQDRQLLAETQYTFRDVSMCCAKTGLFIWWYQLDYNLRPEGD